MGLPINSTEPIYRKQAPALDVKEMREGRSVFNQSSVHHTLHDKCVLIVIGSNTDELAIISIIT